MYTVLHGVIAGAVYETWFIFTASILFTRSASANNHAPLPPPRPTIKTAAQHAGIYVGARGSSGSAFICRTSVGIGILVHHWLRVLIFRSYKISIFFILNLTCCCYNSIWCSWKSYLIKIVVNTVREFIEKIFYLKTVILFIRSLRKKFDCIVWTDKLIIIARQLSYIFSLKYRYFISIRQDVFWKFGKFFISFRLFLHEKSFRTNWKDPYFWNPTFLARNRGAKKLTKNRSDKRIL